MMEKSNFLILLLTFILLLVGMYVDADKTVQLNCEEATQVKCENSLRWEHQCPDQCDPYPNACHSCRDKMYKCDELTKDSEECEDWHMRALCLKTCGVCECDKPSHEEL